jgi:hypothetical protein
MQGQKLMTHSPRWAASPIFWRMWIFTCEGPRSVDDRDVLYVFREPSITSAYCNATLVMANGQEVSGRALTVGVDGALQAKLNDATPPIAA